MLLLAAAFASAAGVRAQGLPGSAEEVAPFVSTPASTIALEDVTIIDGTGAPPRAHQTLVIADGRIQAVGPSAEVRIPAGAVRRRLSGRTVMPGLVMLHEHMMHFSGFRIWHSQPVSYPRLYLAAGVTTVRTAGGDFPYIDLNLSRGIADGRMAGPRMFVTGPNFNDWDGHFLGDVIVRSEADGRREVAYWAAQGATSFKIYAGLAPEAARGIIAEAHARGLAVTGHLGRTTCREAAELGIDNIEHGFIACLAELGAAPGEGGRPSTPPDPARAQALIDLLVRNNVVLTATPVSLDPPSAEVRALLHPTVLANLDSGRGQPPPFFAEFEAFSRALERQFVQSGGRLVIGADAENFGRVAGDANQRALELLVDAGHAPLDVLRMATLEGARLLGIDARTGSIAVGKEADLIVVRGDPSARIADIRAVEEVFRAGIGYDPAKLRTSVQGLVGWR